MNSIFKKKLQEQEGDTIVIRQLRKSDLNALEWGGEYTHFRRLFAASFNSASQGRSVLWVVELPKVGIIGQLFVQLVSSRPELADGIDRAYIYGFRIQPVYRGKGIGSQLLRKAENDLRARGFKCATLNVARENENARRLYERCGYQVVAQEAGVWSYYDHEGQSREVNEPSWRMEKDLLKTESEPSINKNNHHDVKKWLDLFTRKP